MTIWQLLDSRGMGGIESHVLVLTEALRREGMDARIVLLEDHGPHTLVERAARMGLPLEHVGGAGGLWRALRKGRVALLHTHGYKAGLVGRPLARMAGRAVVSTFHNGDRGHGKLRLYTAADRASGRLAEQIAVSTAIARDLQGRVHRIDNFVQVAAACPARRRAGAALRIGFVGRLAREKGIDTYCRLAARIPADWQVFGDGPLAAEASRIAGGAVTFHGMVPDMAPFWPDLDLLCMPSRHEGLPMAALEAMAMGVPILAFGVGGLPDLIENGIDGWLVAAGDEAALSARLGEIANTSSAQRDAVGRRAWQTIRRRFGAQRRLGSVLDVYRLALARARHANLPQDAIAICGTEPQQAMPASGQSSVNH